jgi:hypothetical protein
MATINNFTGSIPINAGGWVFAGSTSTVTIAAGQRLTGSMVLPMTGSGYFSWDLCYRLGAGTTTNMTGGSYPNGNLTGTSIPFTASASRSGIAAGTYTVGFCTNFNNAVINADWGNGWFMVTN